MIEKFANNDPSRLKCIKARFTKHVFPGEMIQTEMWRLSPTRIAFQLRVVDRNEIAVAQAFVDLRDSANNAGMSEASGGQADVIFNKFADNFKKLPDSAKQAIVKKINGIFQFDIGAGVFHIDMKNGNGSIGSGKPSGSPDITVIIGNEKDFVDLASGKVKGQAAYMKGLFKVKGNMMLGMKLDSLLQTLNGSASSKL